MQRSHLVLAAPKSAAANGARSSMPPWRADSWCSSIAHALCAQTDADGIQRALQQAGLVAASFSAALRYKGLGGTVTRWPSSSRASLFVKPAYAGDAFQRLLQCLGTPAPRCWAAATGRDAPVDQAGSLRDRPWRQLRWYLRPTPARRAASPAKPGALRAGRCSAPGQRSVPQTNFWAAVCNHAPHPVLRSSGEVHAPFVVDVVRTPLASFDERQRISAWRIRVCRGGACRYSGGESALTLSPGPKIQARRFSPQCVPSASRFFHTHARLAPHHQGP